MVNLTDGEAMRRGALADGDRATRGAVYVEFLIVFLPLLMFFFTLVQLIFVYTVSLMVENAAVKAARAAIVVLHDDPKFYGDVPTGSYSGARKTEIERAVAISLLPLYYDPSSTPDVGSLVNFSTTKVSLNNSASIVGRDDLVTARVELEYTCRVPLGRYVACFPFSFKHFAAEATMPNQGADFTY